MNNTGIFYKSEHPLGDLNYLKLSVNTADLAILTEDLWCRIFYIEIIRGVVSEDHVHIFSVSAANDGSIGNNEENKRSDVNEGI